MTKQPAVVLRMASLLLLMVYSTDAELNIINTKQDFHVGEEILLVCKAGVEGTATWQKDGEDIDDEEVVKKMDETSSKFIKSATLEDAGRYTCTFEYDSGHQDVVNKEVFVHEGPTFGSNILYHEFLEGTDAIIPCQASGKPRVVVKWLRDKQEISSGESSRVRQLSDNTLKIERVNRADAGTYECEAQIADRPVTANLSISVVVNAPPVVRLREEVKKVLAGPETNVTLLCLVDGRPKPNITWTMPVTMDPSHHQFNSDRSQLIIRPVTRDDYGEYICTATNKIAESSATIMLQVFEAPEVFVSAEQQTVLAGQHASVSCNVSGHPRPELYWLNKHNGQTLDSKSGRVRVVDGVLVIDEMLPSDGGLYSCMAVSITGNASRDVSIRTQPGPPHYLSVSPGPTSAVFSLKDQPVSGGTPITSFVLQWRQSAAEEWKEITVSASDDLAITSLKPYTQYSVRLAALNGVGVGEFSNPYAVRTQGIREPDTPVLSSNELEVKENSFSIPLKHTDDGGNPLRHFIVRYKEDKETAEWKAMQLPSDADSVSLQELSHSSNYQLEVTAVNANGSSIPATFSFTTRDQPAHSRSMTKGSVIGIVMVIFLLVFLVVDATCCYRNRCGLLMSIAVKLFGQRVPGLKTIEEGEGATNGVMKLNGLSTPRGSMQQTGASTLTKEAGQLTEVTCDKAPLTKHEKQQPGRGLHPADA